MQTKANPLKPRRGLHLYALLSHQTLSVIAPIFLKSLFVKLPNGMSRWSFKLVCEILRVSIFVRVFFILSIRNLDLQSGVCCILTWQSCHVPRSWTCITSGFNCHSSATELFASLTMTAYNQVFSHSVVNWWNTLLINCAYELLTYYIDR